MSAPTASSTARALVDAGNAPSDCARLSVIAELDVMLDRHLQHNGDLLRDAARQYSSEHYARLTGLLPEDMVERLQAETRRLIAMNTRRIDITVEVTGNTPRRMGSLPNSLFEAQSVEFISLYHVPAFRRLLTAVAGAPVLDCPYADERITGTHQTQVGDTHGWHWGDHEFAFIFIAEAPGPECGGLLQSVPHTPWDKADPQVNRCLTEGAIRSYHHRSGESYFFKTDTSLHRTSPIEADDVTRSIVNLTFAGVSDLLQEKTYETTDAVYLD